MKAKNKRRLNRMMSIILVFMLMSYYVPIGLVVATAEGAGEDTGETGVFTLEIVKDSEVEGGTEPVAVVGATVSGTNGKLTTVEDTTDEYGKVQFEEITNSVLEEGKDFIFTVTIQNDEKIEAMDVPIKIINSSDHYIYNWTTDKVEKVETGTDPGQNPDPEPVTFDVTLDTSSSSGTGTVTIGEEVNPEIVKVKEGENVVINVTPDEGSKIETIMIDGVNEQDISDDGSFEKTMQITKDTEIKVNFAKIYTISFSSYEDGTVEDEDGNVINATEGKITASHGTSPSFTVIPNTGFHIDKIIIDEQEYDFSKELLEDGSFEHSFNEISQNHSVEITFAINKYQITTNVNGENGFIKPELVEVEHNAQSKVIIEIKPDDDYQIKSLTDNTVSVVDAVLQADGTYFYEIVGIFEDHNIVVEFEEITPAEQPWEKYVTIEAIEGELIAFDPEKNIRIYSKDAEVKIKPIESGAKIKLNGQWGFWNWEKDITINKNTTIWEIEIGKGMRKEELTFNPNLIIHFDEEQPEISEVTLSESPKATVDGTDWYSGEVTVTGKAIDVEQYFEENDYTYSSEIVNVYYKQGDYSPDSGTEASYDKTTKTFEFTIQEDHYSGIYSIWAEDEAGNVTIEPVEVNIDNTNPTLIDDEDTDAITFKQVNSNNMSEFINFLSFGTFFNKEIEVTVRAQDKGAGIESIDLNIFGSKEKVGIEKGEFNRDGSTVTQVFTIDKEEFTGSLTVELTDRTKNTSGEVLITKDNSNIDADNSGVIMIEKVAPTADIYLTSETTGTELEDGQEFNQDVSIGIDAGDTDSGINEVVLSVNGKEQGSYTYHSEQINEATYTISTDAIDSEDGKYTISVYVIDNAGNTTTTEKTVYVDKTSPVINGIYLETNDDEERVVIDEEDILEDYVEKDEYGYYFKKDLIVTVVAEDQVVSGEHTSGVESMVVYLKDSEGNYFAVLETGEIKKLNDSGEIHQITPITTDREVSFEVPASFKGEIVAKASDQVGNTGAFESAQGTIVESPDQHNLEEHIDFTKAETIYKDNQGVDLYSEDVPVEIVVTDTYSGIKKIEWSVEAPYETEKNQYGSLIVNNDKSYADGSDSTGWVQSPTDDNLVTEMKKTINVNHNSNDIMVRVKMTDRAGNVSEEEIKLSIDKTDPELEIEYDNNTPDEENGNIYNESRTATITITERNFNPEDVQYSITKSGSDFPVTLDWTTVEPEEGEHPDKTKHIATIAFTDDGEYKFNISYMDSAENEAPKVDEQTFIIDRSAPEVSVSYDNNDVKNEKYYKDTRTATITVTEHNFDPNRVEIAGSTTIIGETIESLPPLSEWNSVGDVHTATIIFEKDALYHYDIEVSDTAGNTSDDFEAEEFYIDKTDAVLVDGEAVTFKQKNDGTFAKVLNFLTFGTFFNKEVQITVKTLDATSGIEEIELKTVNGQLINQDDISINEDELTGEAVFVLDVDSFDAELEVDITDLAHNVGTYAVTAENSNIASEKSNIVVEKEKPNVTINVIPGKGVTNYKNQYNGDVTFEVVTEDNDSGINTVIIDVNGKKYEYDYSDLAEMQKKPDAYRINTNHKDIVGNEDGSYLISVHVVDNAGNENEAETKIYIDKTNPIITNYEFSIKGKNGFVKVDETDKFKKSLELTEYGYYFKEPTQVKISGEDPKVDKEFTSNLKTITVYLKDHENGKYYAALKNGSLKEIKESEIGSITPIPTKNSVTVNVPKAFKGQIFAQATDYVQNTGAYIAPNGMVVENKAQHNKETHIKLDRAKAPYKDNNGVDLYSNNVNVELTVTDSYSGIEEIEWSVIAPYDTGNNQGGNLKLNNDKTYADGSNTKGWKQTKTQLNLVTEMKKTITVNNNSNDIKVRVKMTDRAGHTSEEEITFSIDKTSPSINVTYDNNSPDPQNQDYYKDNRTATITITERNFKPEDVVHVVTNTDNVIPVLNGWSTSRNSNNPDLTTHTATITYSADGDYTFDIQYTDNAGNKAAPVPQDSFTIDKTKPVINVSYDTDDAVNGNYFNTTRTATISITEHNFDPSRIEVIGTAFHDGEVVNFPSLSGWTRNGDVHTASIVYSNDALYTFDIDYTDMAGNVADDVTPQEFHVDQTEPELTIVGVENMSANNGEVAPIIRYSDTNFDPDSVEIELTGSNRGDVELKGEYSGRNNGQVFIFDDFARTKENDDLYTLSVSLVDLAGNESTEEIRFSVNRFGSVYAFDDSLDELVGKYVQNEQDIIITETNVNSLDKDSINLKMTHNGSPSDLKAGEDFTISETGGEDTWSQYTYTIHKELFAGDGRYTITLYSEDAAGNTNENIDEKKKAEISFGIDKTSPVVVPIDIEEGEQYAVDSKTATISVKDNLVLDQVKISLNNEEIAFEENGENYTFVIPNSNSTQEVTILATDAAGNEITAEVRDFLVTTNLLARWYNNKPLFFGSLGGTGVIGVALAAFFLYRKRNNVADEVEMEEKAG